ncbi:MAG TPA: hypothetical protein PKM73_08620 [Verrucomicrobiota bacterium]|nr:hypothetical protein [Verrucomicrobiota bacterium]HNU51819.1 hypothetical protein [Verrucomicrobiota bacterium]
MIARQLITGTALAVISASVTFVALAGPPDINFDPPAVIVYDNTVNSLGTWFGTTSLYPGSDVRYEFGDEILMSGFEGQELLVIKAFEFAYTTELDFVSTPDKKWVLNFYANDGAYIDPDMPQLGRKPMTLLAPSVEGLIEGDGGAYVTLPALSFVIPKRFTWTVSFQGLEEGDDVGLDLFNPVAVGSSADDFWVLEPTGWVLRELEGGFVPANFYAQVLAIPEPSVLQLGLFASLGAMGLWLIRRK